MDNGGGQKKPAGCGLLTLFCGQHRRSSSTGSILRRPRPIASSSPYKSLRSIPNNELNKPAATPTKRLPALTPGNGLSGELESMIFDYQKAKGSSNMVRASSGNVMVYGHLGNIMGNQNPSIPALAPPAAVTASSTAAPGMRRALSRRTDPEALKEMGNEEYMKGRFAEAVALYDQAIAVDPEKASYRSNKAVALAGMGKTIEAIAECEAAVRIDPCYCRAHYRLANLYLRVGEAEKAVHHYKLSRSEADPSDTARAKNLQICVKKFNEARNYGDWKTMLKECQSAISIGADSSPKVIAVKAEALLILGKHEEADSVLKNASQFDAEKMTSFFGATTNSYILMIRAQVSMAAGRFDEAVEVVKVAAELDQTNREISAVVRKTIAVASARKKGNELFATSKYEDACLAYGQGLRHDPHNAILLCNRAACHSKLGKWDKAIEECSFALNFRPSYVKARLRRADCYAKLEKWKEAVEDYETLMRQVPVDEQLVKALQLAQSHLQRNTE
ncbi:Inactive TPR repeat-containing thioredoxin TTL3 [Apostasia shenzhenica]|uniref:Inactive TPR repeat-containing thioredoxin TTL3 n=1 Tax=Apostasia shenzhenica TaxID=1088818 RepID=A0A2I0AMJ2_9ASPA|nr:Inactive TPR repeat-containing thioredoxin TTL3 [Apostasia shenzhenica]